MIRHDEPFMLHGTSNAFLIVIVFLHILVVDVLVNITDVFQKQHR